MTAAATEEDLDLALDWDPIRMCEHPHHGDLDPECHRDVPATHWAVTTHACFGPLGAVYPICPQYAEYVALRERGTNARPCLFCPELVTPDVVRIVGRIQ